MTTWRRTLAALLLAATLPGTPIFAEPMPSGTPVDVPTSAPTPLLRRAQRPPTARSVTVKRVARLLDALHAGTLDVAQATIQAVRKPARSQQARRRELAVRRLLTQAEALDDTTYKKQRAKLIARLARLVAPARPRRKPPALATHPAASAVPRGLEPSLRARADGEAHPMAAASPAAAASPSTRAATAAPRRVQSAKRRPAKKLARLIHSVQGGILAAARATQRTSAMRLADKHLPAASSPRPAAAPHPSLAEGAEPPTALRPAPTTSPTPAALTASPTPAKRRASSAASRPRGRQRALAAIQGALRGGAHAATRKLVALRRSAAAPTALPSRALGAEPSVQPGTATAATPVAPTTPAATPLASPEAPAAALTEAPPVRKPRRVVHKGRYPAAYGSSLRAHADGSARARTVTVEDADADTLEP